MGELPHLKALVERHDESKFAVLGINTDADPDMFRKQCEEKGVTWDNIFAGSPGGKVPQSWAVTAYPSIYVVNPEGVICAVNPRGKDLETVVDKLLEELSS